MSQYDDLKMKMLYGVNQADACQAFAIGESSERIQQRLRDISTRLIRLFLYDKGAPDPVTQWPVFVSYVQAVLNVGATPMMTFAKMHKPVNDLEAVDEFANRCGDVVHRCIEHWGGDVVRNWYWCVWNEPNNEWISGPVTLAQYCHIYEQVADRCLRWLKPHLAGRRPLIGGPAVEGFQPFWMDWVWRFLNEIDNELIGFLDWHCYGDWREHGENNAPIDGAAHRRLMMGMIGEYGNRARVIGQMLEGRQVLNICGELNCHSHYTQPVRERFNYSVFAATFYTSALLQLMRQGVDAEMYWVGTEDQGGYGMLNKHGDPWPSFYAKKLCAEHVRYGDLISFPTGESGNGSIDVVIARGEGGRRSALVVHQKEQAASYDLSNLIPGVNGLRTIQKIDEGTNNRIVQASYDGRIHFEGFGVAAVTAEIAGP
jgi:Glycosyl hydrolases family 39